MTPYLNLMKAYLAGPLCSKMERDYMEKLDSICKELGVDTFLPHRDCGLWKEGIEFKEIAEQDIKGFEKCDFLIANLNGFNIGAGTAWEMGYAEAKNIPVIAIKTDKKLSESVEGMSAIILGITKIVTNTENLKIKIEELIKRLS